MSDAVSQRLKVQVVGPRSLHQPEPLTDLIVIEPTVPGQVQRVLGIRTALLCVQCGGAHCAPGHREDRQAAHNARLHACHGRLPQRDGGGIGPARLVEENAAAKETHGDEVMADALTLEDKDGATGRIFQERLHIDRHGAKPIFPHRNIEREHA